MAGINRREMLKMGSACSLAALATTTALPAVEPKIENNHVSVARWEVFELALTGPSSGNPFMDVQLAATFKLEHRTVKVNGFYDGAGAYKLRFMPDTEGEWTYTTSSNAAALDGKTGRFACSAALPHVHGPVSVQNEFHFAYADGTPFSPFGTTCYAWVHQTEALQEQTLETLRTAPFNKIRMCVFPKSYEYNHNEPPLYPFERNAAGVSDFTRPDPAYFAHLEKRIADLRALDIESDLILFHPYDRWGYASMPAEADDRYLSYVIARMSAYRNIWWSLANEYDFMKAKTTQDFDRFFQIVEQKDPVGHLRSFHNGHTIYDNRRPWVTHASIQGARFEQAAEWHKLWQKPICFDEVQYEGNLNRRWGNLSGADMMQRFWLGVIAGCYVTHGETYLDPDGPFNEDATPTIWWSHGGTLHGTSPARIAFLRKIVEESASGPRPRQEGLDAQPGGYYTNTAVTDLAGKQQEEILYYFDYHQPIYNEFPLSDGKYTAELIDPWEMKISRLPGTFTGKTKLKLAGKPFQALRFRRIP